MIKLSVTAQAQVASLRAYYLERHRIQAIANLADALLTASRSIQETPERGLPAPRPYPALSALGLRWIKCNRYWLAYKPDGAEIAAIFFETDGIPGRIG